MKQYLVMLISLILLTTSVYALSATTLTGVIQVNFEDTPITVQKSIGIKNDNNISIDVYLRPSDEIANLTQFGQTNFSLEPDEEMFIPFNLTITEPKAYKGSIKIIYVEKGYTIEDTQHALGITTTVIAVPKMDIGQNSTNSTLPLNTTSNESNQTVPATGGETDGGSAAGKWLLPAMIIGGIILIAISVILIKRSAGGKNE